MQLIYPAHKPIAGPDDVIDAYAYPKSTGEPYVRANMVATLDGAAWGGNHRSGSISSPPDREVFAILRGLADVILVGAETARREGYGPAVTSTELGAHRAELGQRPDPTMAIVSRSLAFDRTASLFTDATERTIVLTTQSSPQRRRDALSETATVVIAGIDAVDFRVARHALAERGLTRVLCEGGPHLLAGVVQAGLLDELCLTVTPQLGGGDAERILGGCPPLTDTTFDLAHILEEDGTLLTRWTAPPGTTDG